MKKSVPGDWVIGNSKIDGRIAAAAQLSLPHRATQIRESLYIPGWLASLAVGTSCM